MAAVFGDIVEQVLHRLVKVSHEK